MSDQIEVKVPDIGDFEGVEVIEMLVSQGDQIAVDDSLITVESDKASMEIPSSHAGTVVQLHVALGDKVSEGDVILTLEADESASVATATKPEADTQVSSDKEKVDDSAQAEKQADKDANAQAAAPTPSAQPRPSPTAALLADTPIDQQQFVRAHASPAVRKFARELGVDLSKVSGSGRNQRILKQDVQAFVKQSLASGGAPATTSAVGGSMIEPIPTVDFSQWGSVDDIKLSRINVLTGKAMQRNWLNIPHVTQFDEADITDLEAFRKQANQSYQDQGFKLTMVAFLLKASANALQKFPRFNSSLSPDGKSLIHKNYIHIGVAVATKDGLVVPVIRDVDQKSLSELARDLKELSTRARAKQLAPADMQGGTFTISSLGGIGGTAFTPIVNAPEVAILGVSRAQMKAQWNGSEFVPRLMCPLSLSYDHRVIDGADGATFTRYLGQLLSDVRLLLI